MNTYEFTLKFRLPEADLDTDALIARLSEAGCDDALVGVGQAGRLALSFAREAGSAFRAVSSALECVFSAVSGAELIEATPDFVGVTDVASLLGCSRQNVRMLILRGGSEFPAPVHEGASVVWRLSSVLAWLKNSKSYPVEDRLLEIAETNMQFNIARASLQADPVKGGEIRSLLS